MNYFAKTIGGTWDWSRVGLKTEQDSDMTPTLQQRILTIGAPEYFYDERCLCARPYVCMCVSNPLKHLVTQPTRTDVRAGICEVDVIRLGKPDSPHYCLLFSQHAPTTFQVTALVR